MEAIAQAKTKIEARAREQAEYEAKLARGVANEAATGKKLRGKPLQSLQAVRATKSI